MPLRRMEIDSGVLEIAMAEENLDGGQVGAGLQQVGGKAVPERVRVKRFAKAGTLGGLAAGPPDDFVGDRGISGVPASAGKQPRSGRGFPPRARAASET